jgi:hypothetical protein
MIRDVGSELLGGGRTGRPAFLSDNLAQAVDLLNRAGFCVVAKNRMAELIVDAGVQEPPDGTPKDQVEAHWNAVGQRLTMGLCQAFIERRLFVVSKAPMPDKPGFIAFKVAAILVTPPGASSQIAPRQRLIV